MTLHNVLLMLIDHRDLLNSLVLDESSGVDVRYAFSLECKLKKYYNPVNCTVNVQHGYFSSLYGMKYHGFQYRMIITPLTERFFMSLSIVSHESCGYGVPVVSGKPGNYKAQMIEYLSFEFGNEVAVQNCGFVWSPHHV